jgi:hypothetical protein
LLNKISKKNRVFEWKSKDVKNEKVVCFSVPNGVLVTRNKNKIAVQGNSKNMLHCFRLLYSGKNILTFGSPIVRFEGKQREFLMDIRRNKFTYEYLMELVEKEMKELDELKETSTLPWGCDVTKVNELYLELIQ